MSMAESLSAGIDRKKRSVERRRKKRCPIMKTPTPVQLWGYCCLHVAACVKPWAAEIAEQRSESCGWRNSSVVELV